MTASSSRKVSTSHCARRRRSNGSLCGTSTRSIAVACRVNTCRGPESPPPRSPPRARQEVSRAGTCRARALDDNLPHAGTTDPAFIFRIGQELARAFFDNRGLSASAHSTICVSSRKPHGSSPRPNRASTSRLVTAWQSSRASVRAISLQQTEPDSPRLPGQPHDLCHGFACARQHDPLAGLGCLDKLRKRRLGLVNIDLSHL